MEFLYGFIFGGAAAGYLVWAYKDNVIAKIKSEQESLKKSAQNFVGKL